MLEVWNFFGVGNMVLKFVKYVECFKVVVEFWIDVWG